MKCPHCEKTQMNDLLVLILLLLGWITRFIAWDTLADIQRETNGLV